MTDTTSNEAAQNLTSAGADDDRRVDPELVALARRAAIEGSVLLTNDGALPLAPGAPVAVFGRVQLDWVAVGYGSGGDVNPPYVTNLLDCLLRTGLVLDEELAATYRRWCHEHPVPAGQWGEWPRHFEEMPVDDGLIERAAAGSRSAVVVIGRAAGEDRDNVLEPGSYFLTDDEHRLLERVTGAFERVVVVVNSGNVMDLSWSRDPGISAVLLAWPGGMEGARAIAAILSGQAEPGGRLPDTVAHRYEDYPSAGSFGDEAAGHYAEDVFVGYRYFETFAPEAVLFPFGHGLGYTTFTMTAGSPRRRGTAVTLPVLVTNTGQRSGSTVIQVYAAAPPFGGPSTPARRLVGFVRTDELAPGATQELSLTVPVERLAVFDDSGFTGHRNAWVLEAGEHELLVGPSVREARSAGAIVVEGIEVVEQLEEALAPAGDHPFKRMRAVRSGQATATPAWEDVPTASVDLRERIVSRLPAPVVEADGAADPASTLNDVARGRVGLGAFVASLSPTELADLGYGDITMDSPLGAPGNAGAFGGVTPALRERGIPAVTTTDGPSGIRLSAFAALLPCGTALASTWDPALIEAMEALHGREMLRKGSDVLLAPGMNIHRDPLCGRNFEYFSEDPLLTGLCAAAYVRGLQSQGVSACPKHLACNNQETNRLYHDSRVSQRALREIYLRGFEIVVKQAAPRTIMTSYNKINGQWAHYNYDLVTTILREQWGYDGVVITDWWMRYAPDPLFTALGDSATRLRAQVDVLMPGAASWSAARTDGHDDSILEGFDPADAGGEHLTLGELQRTAVNVLGLVVSSPAMQRLEAQREGDPLGRGSGAQGGQGEFAG